MKRVLAFLAVAFLAVQGMATGAQAALVDAPVDSSEFLTIGGVDWAWASPCSPDAPSCGLIDMSFQGPLGWAIASVSQINSAIDSAGGLSAWVDLFAGGNICASAYFSPLYDHCDYNDGYAGLVHNYLGHPVGGAGYDGYYDEVFVVRVSAIPVPASLPLLIGGVALLGLLGRAKRRV